MKNLLLAWLGIACVAAGLGGCIGEHRDARDKYNEGVAALAKGEYEAAEKALLTLLTGLAYPLAVTGFAWVMLHDAALGSHGLVCRNGNARGRTVGIARLVSLAGDLDLLLIVRSVHFGNQRLQYRRPGRDFGHLDPINPFCSGARQNRPHQSSDQGMRGTGRHAEVPSSQIPEDRPADR